MLYILMMGCRYTRNMWRCLTKYTEVLHQAGLSLNENIEMHGQQTTKCGRYVLKSVYSCQYRMSSVAPPHACHLDREANEYIWQTPV